MQALVEHYEALAARGELPPPGWGTSAVSYALCLAENGDLLQVMPLFVERTSGNKVVMGPQTMLVPWQVQRSSGVSANFLCDNSSYFLGKDNKGNAKNSQERFAAGKALHTEILTEVDSLAARAVLAFFATWQPERIEEHAAFADCLQDVLGGANLVFRVQGSFAHEDAAIRAQWQRVYNSRIAAQEEATCLVTGEKTHIARLNPNFKGVRGAQMAGASLVSFNAEAYSSYGKEGGQNAPVGEYAAFAYGTALAALLADRQHRQFLGDTTVVFWAAGGQRAPQNLCAALLGGNKDIAESDLKAAMNRLAQGKPTEWEGAEIAPETPFFILGIAPNAARLSVRFFLRNSFGNFIKQLQRHQQRLAVTRPAFDTRELLSFWDLLQETVNKKLTDSKPSPLLAGELVRAVFSGGSYPASLLNGVMLRIRAEQEVTRGRAAILKAYYLCNPNPGCPEEVLTMQLNESTNIPYRLGRLFSVLEALQQAANPGINATIKDKYFNAASATPDRIFPILIDLAQKHLRKLEGGLRYYYDSQIIDILSTVDELYPARMTLPQRAAFQLGYYHQTQKRYEKKEEVQEDA